MTHAGSAEKRATVAAGLWARRHEIERATLERVQGISGDPQPSDPEYVDGLRASVDAAVVYAVRGIERVDQPVPDALLSQARAAARTGVGIQTVLMRYMVGSSLFADFLVHEAERVKGLRAVDVKDLLRTQASLLESAVTAVAVSHRDELDRCQSEARPAAEARIERLLGGELVDSAELGYQLEVRHVGLVVVGPGAHLVASHLAREVRAELLSLRRPGERVWAWLGGLHLSSIDQLTRVAAECAGSGVYVAVGEPADGLEGWRATHRQSRAAMLVARRASGRVARYRDVALLASALQDDLLLDGLRRLYLEPLSSNPKGQTLRSTLRAYFSASGNVSSTAAALRVSRQTVTKRLSEAEERLGRPLGSCASELALALNLELLAEPPSWSTISERNLT